MIEYYRKCEESIKEKILYYYSKYMSKNQINAFKSKDYLDDSALSIKGLSELFNFLIEKMLKDLLNKDAYKSVYIDEENTVSVPCGKTLRDSLVNYYKKDLSMHFNYDAVINKKLAFEIDTIHFFNQTFENIINKNVFIKNAIEMESIEEISEFVKYCNQVDLDDYLENHKQLFM